MIILTIFTPAYNRAHTIRRTYKSLISQTNKNFIWLVVDDGSTDETESLIADWITDNIIQIQYIKQQNQGMHGAHNTAYANIQTELNICIDSDDFMPHDAVDKILKFWEANKSDNYAGIIGLDQREDGSIIGTPFPDVLKETTLQGFYANGGKGDKKLVYRTDVIKQYPDYPIFEGEKYVGLAYKYMLIDQDYKLLILNEPLVTVEYQTDGSSYNMYNQYWKNPKGFSFFRKTEMIYAPTLKRRFISCIHYVASSIISKNYRFIKDSPKPIMTTLAIPFGYIWYRIIKHKVISGQKYKMK